MSKVFLSYVSENFEKVNEIKQILEGKGLEVWFDKDALKPGDWWKTEIKNGIKNGDFFVPFFSKEYNDKGRNVMNEELIIAVEELRLRINTKFFIPVILNDCEVPNWDIGMGRELSDIQWVDLREITNKSINELVNVIKPINEEEYILDYDSEEDGIFKLWDWAYEKGLSSLEKESKLKTIKVEKRPPFPLKFNEEKFIETCKLTKPKYNGTNYYLVGIDAFDNYGEYDEGIEMKLNTCEYYEFQAIRRIFHEDNVHFKAVESSVKILPSEYINNNPLPTHINTNIVVLNKSLDKFLGTYRGKNVSTANDMWVVSINETMRAGNEKYSSDSDIFETMERGLFEELGLSNNQYDKIVLSYLGIVPPRLGVHCIGITRLLIDDDEIKEVRHKNAPDAYEQTQIRWFPFSKAIVGHFLMNKGKGIDERKDKVVMVDKGPLANKSWLHHVPICLKEAYKMRGMFEK